LLLYDQDVKEVQTLLKRFRKHRNSIFTFINYKDVPFDNNGSERAIRMAKVKQKISGCNRSDNGARRESAILTIIETAKKQNMDILSSIRLLPDGKLKFSFKWVDSYKYSFF
jgi:transposase